MRVRCTLLSMLALAVGTAVVRAQPSAVVFYHPFEDRPAATLAADPEVDVIDGPAEFAPGKRGNGMVVGDGRAYLVFDAANIPMPAGTLELWLKPLNWDGMATDTFHVFVETDRDENGHWFLVYKYFMAQNAGFIWENGQSIFQRKITGWRDWVHFAVTWSPAGCRLYFNGVPSAVTKPDAPPARYSGKMFVGDRPWQFERDEQTIIDELYIYNRALEPEEISWAFENAAARAAGRDVPAGFVPTKVYARILPSAGKIVAEVKHRLAKRALADRVTGTARLLGPTALAPVPLTIDEATAEATLSFDTLAEGDYRLRVEFKDASGGIVDSAEDAFFCPANEQ